MAILDGCEEKKRTPVLKEVKCPKCGEMVEVFLRDGRVVEDSECTECGHVIKEGEMFDIQ